MTQRNIQALIENCIAIGTTSTLELLGVSSGEISQRKAKEVYGKYFINAVNSGRIHPCRVEDGRAGTRWYKVSDILTLKAKDAIQAELIVKL